MFYSDNHVEVSLDAFLASEDYTKESIKDVELVFDQNADRSTKKIAHSAVFFCGADGKSNGYGFAIYSDGVTPCIFLNTLLK